MKKLILIVLFFNVAFYGFSQTDDTNKELLRTTEKILDVLSQQTDEAKAASIRVTANEIGLNVFNLAFPRILTISYERIKNSEIGFGLTASICFNSDELDLGDKFAFTPFFRYYFFSKKDYGSKGFYYETFLKFFGYKDYDYSYPSYTYFDVGYGINYKEKTAFDAALGVGLGYKFVSRGGFVLDLNLGGGRSFGNGDFVGRGGITFGYRF
ncbi:MAG: hypothetical protein LBI82_05805 [Dysgonamonadaceae bacterium]|nr:hypothetical protein [Dysgonamonadaceae bacterium]